MQPSASMGDSRHKNSPPPSEDEDDVPPDFPAKAKAQLAENRRLNQISGAQEGGPNYKIDSQAALARAVEEITGYPVSEKHISNIIGPVREGSKWDRVYRSAYVAPIAQALEFEATANLKVPLSRATILSWLARLSDEKFKKFEEALEAARAAEKS